MPAIIKVVDGRTIIKMGENTALASKYATLAEQFADAAGVSADAVEIAAAAVGVYTTVGAGESATTNGQSFYVASGGNVTLYLNNAGTGDEVASIATNADVAARPTFTELASTAPGEGASLVLTESGDTVQDWLSYITGPVIYAAAYGVFASPIIDNTASMIAALAVGHLVSGTLILPKGVIRCGDIGNLASAGFTMKGAGLGVTVLQATHTSSSGHAILPSGTAFFADAFESGSGSDPFIDEFNLFDFTFEGNANTTNIFWFQGIARSNFKIEAREAGGPASKAFHLRGCMSNTLELICSTNRKAMTYVPSYGIYMDAGSRAGASIGQCSNNLFIRPAIEGPLIGIRLAAADQNIFLGGAAQACTQTGLSISNLCRYNTFNGVSFENALADHDVTDQGIQTQYNNCYSVKTFLMQGKQPIVKGGYFERFELSGTCEQADVSNIRINAWDTGAGGWFDSGIATKWRGIYDHDLAAFIYPQKARTSITVGASPFTWVNTTGLPVEVILQSGTVSQVRGLRNGVGWLANKTIPGGNIVAPGDSLEVIYSVAPDMSYLPLNGL